MKHLDFSSLRVRLVLLIILASIPAMVLIVNHAAEERSAATAQIQADTLQLTQLTVSNQEQWIEGSRQLLIALGSLPAVRNLDGATASEFFAEIRKEYPLYANIFAATPDGDLFASSIPMGKPVNSADLTWFKRAVSTRDFAISDYQDIGRITGVAVIVAAYPIYDDEGNLQAVVCASLDLEWLNEQARQMDLPPGATFRVIDREGTILARYPNHEKLVGQSMPEADIIQTILVQHEGTAEATGVDGVKRIFAFAPVYSRETETGIFASIGIPISVAFAQINRILVRDLTLLGIVILFMLLIAWFGSEFFVLRNVNALMNATQRLGAGDLSARTGILYDQGEMGELDRVFDGVAVSLQEREAERKKAEEELHASFARNEAILSAVPDIVMEVDVNKVYKWANKPGFEFFGKDVLGHEADFYFEGEQDTYDVVQPLFNGMENVFYVESWQRRKDGEKRLLAWWCRTLKDTDGNVTGALSTARDITEHKQTEEKLNHEHNLMQYIISHAQSAIAVHDRDLKYMYVSDQYIRQYKVKEKDVIGKHHYEVFPDLPQKWRDVHQKALAGEVSSKDEDPFVREDGTVDWTRWECRPWYEADGSIGGIIIYTEVITERKQAEEELKKHRDHLEELVEERTASLNIKTNELSQANARLKEMDELKSMFIASMSHELRTPLNSIIGFSGMTLQGLSGELNEEQKDNLTRVTKSARHLLSLITDVIDISKIEAGRIDVFPEPFTLHELIAEAVSTIEPQAKAKGLALEVDVPPDITMNTDKKRLLQCILNYMSNAIKFTETGKVTLCAREIDDDVEITVIDTGIGIAEKDIPKLFEAFERLETHLRLKAGGTGLGLYLTKKMGTEILHGNVGVKSIEGKGSTFNLRIPKMLLKTGETK